ncbi:RhuM family protein [Cytophaga sp. FL35]|uniref:RhuM family protein n=1 Tax=Cytophaga sp. FL35 TaxID=1904456 RepID=UPI0016538E87|nr:RhuM family protein [Cytophaga sp. FL35]MBC7000338.1 virulence RhuM family protein [Cytophaga sp. FL35]
MGEVVIYKSDNNQIEVSVQLDKETVWLNQEQLTQLFNRDRTVIGRHIRNIFKEGELVEDLVSANFAHTTQHGAIEGKTQTKSTKYYNLDVIISVGYRVKSHQGTQFRIWANRVLKEFLVKGYAINEKRLQQKEQEVKLLKDGIHILTRAATLAIEEKASENAILEIFAKGLSLLDDYDHEQLDIRGSTKRDANYPSLKDYQTIIKAMLTEFSSGVFGKEKDNSFESAVKQIEKGFGNQDFYPTLEEKAATLLYLIVKNHAFVDGNKRIAAACFLKFLEQNNMLYTTAERLIINNDTLASLTLFIASSKPEEMETVKRLVISVLNRNR